MLYVFYYKFSKYEKKGFSPTPLGWLGLIPGKGVATQAEGLCWAVVVSGLVGALPSC